MHGYLVFSLDPCTCWRVSFGKRIRGKTFAITALSKGTAHGQSILKYTETKNKRTCPIFQNAVGISITDKVLFISSGIKGNIGLVYYMFLYFKFYLKLLLLKTTNHLS